MFHFQLLCMDFANFLRLIFRGLTGITVYKLNYLTDMYKCCLKNGWWSSCLSISVKSLWMSPPESLFPNFASVISWQCLSWGHITICWAMCIASVIPSPWGTTPSTRLNDWTSIDTQIFTTVWTLVPNIFCTVCTKWNTTTSARNKCYYYFKKPAQMMFSQWNLRELDTCMLHS